MTDETPVALASTNKGMTALAVLQLVERGLVELDAPVTRYLPAFAMDDARAGAITLRQLLSHSAGIPGGAAYDGAQDGAALERRVAALAGARLHRDPGAGYEYANDGYSVAGLVVQTVAGVPYERYMAERVFAPLGMDRTTFDPARAAGWGLAQTYAKRRGALAPEPVVFTRGLNPAGGALAPARDLGPYLAALLNGGAFRGARVLAPASVEELWRGQVEMDEGGAYGLGWEVGADVGGLRVVQHTGDHPTSGSEFLLLPDRRLGVGVLVNAGTVDKSTIARDALAILLGQEPPARPAPPDLARNPFVPDRAGWGAYTGDYQTQIGPLTVYREGDRLLGTSPGSAPRLGTATDLAVEFVAVGDAAFVLLSDISPLDELLVEFRPAPDGGVGLLAGGQPFGARA
jgi:CubicO group peptidase (beta-lactamase class C family)